MTLVREPLQVVEIAQPLCAHRFGLAPCRAGLGDVDTSAVTVNFADVGLGSDYVGNNATLTAITGGINVAATAPDPQVACEPAASGFSGDDFRYIVIHGRANVVPSLLEWRVFYGLPSVTRRITAKNISSEFRGVTLGSIVAGQEFVAVFDAAESTNYATDWLGTTIDRLRFDLGAGADTDFDLYSITICSEDLTEAAPCFNTRATCQDIVNFEAGDPLSIYLVEPNANRPTLTGFDPSTALPFLKSVSTAPTILNVAAGNKDFDPLGVRAVANITLSDARYNDVGLDPYVSDRPHDVEAQGTWLGRWLARNPYHTGYISRVYDGFRGDDLAAMIQREFFVDKIDRGSDSARVTAKDVLRKITDTDITAPLASTGILASDITASATSMTIAGALVADYPAPGRVRINDEVIGYTGVADVGGNLSFTGLTRGDLDTVAADHSQDDGAQWVLSYEAVRFDSIIYDLAVTRAGIDAGYVTFSDWEDEAALWRPLYIFTRHLTEPVKIKKLIGELAQQAQSHIWWDERLKKIRMEAQRANSIAVALGEAGDIVADSLTLREDAKDRADRVDVYYGLRSVVANPNEKASYRARESVLDIESATNHGETATKEILAAWVPTNILARSIATNFVNRFKNARKRVTFSLPVKNIEDLWTGDAGTISHWMLQDTLGAPLVSPWLITSAETVEQGGEYRFTAEDNESAGILWVWADEATTSPDWDSATEEERATVGYWCDADGNNPDGSPSPFRWL